MPRVDIHSEIPDNHPSKGVVEAVFRDALAQDGRTWSVIIYMIHGIFWTVHLVRDDGFRKVLLLDDPREQRPDFIAGLLGGLVAEANAWQQLEASPRSASL